MVSDRRQDAAACVSLSKSTMSKTNPAKGRTRRLRPAAARRGVSIRDPSDCQSPRPINLRKRLNFERKNRPGPPGHAPSVLGDSIEGAETMSSARENQDLFVRGLRPAATRASRLRRGDIGAQSLRLGHGLGDLGLDQIADGDDAHEAVIDTYRQMADAPVGHALQQG